YNLFDRKDENGSRNILLLRRPEAVKELVFALKNESDLDIRKHAVLTLAEIGYDSDIPIMKEEMEKEWNKEAKTEFMMALALMYGKESKWFHITYEMYKNNQMDEWQKRYFWDVLDELNVERELTEIKKEATAEGLGTIVSKVELIEKALKERDKQIDTLQRGHQRVQDYIKEVILEYDFLKTDDRKESIQRQIESLSKRIDDTNIRISDSYQSMRVWVTALSIIMGVLTLLLGTLFTLLMAGVLPR
ncbi:MAG: hypothetical protein ACTSSK_08555, partial [Candidatus Heimdallarchaeota archaeon]